MQQGSYNRKMMIPINNSAADSSKRFGNLPKHPPFLPEITAETLQILIDVLKKNLTPAFMKQINQSL